jgi:hypothetical protein
MPFAALLRGGGLTSGLGVASVVVVGGLGSTREVRAACVPVAGAKLAERIDATNGRAKIGPAEYAGQS